MKCSQCKEQAVYPRLCKKHFIQDFETRVWDAINKYKMILPGDDVCVGVSGGKDSMSLLFLLNKKYEVTALCIDEGIHGYREKTLLHLRSFCEVNKIPLKVVSFKDASGMTLDERMKSSKYPCTVCGKLRRDLLNEHAKGFDKLAIGHNLDDEAQTVLMNLCTNKEDKQFPVSPKSEGFVPRIKPFFLVSEKEVMLYAVLHSLQPPFVECPYMHEAFRNDVRDALNAYEIAHPGTKRNIMDAHLALVRF
jgi:tRNA(Ile)-lysidine synthase TilS/MesJ